MRIIFKDKILTMIKNPVVDFENGTYQIEEPVIFDCIKYLKSNGITALFINCYLEAPHINVVVQTNTERNTAREFIKQNGKTVLYDFFQIISKQHEFQSRVLDFDPNFIISFESFELICVDCLARRCRNVVKQELNNEGISHYEVYCRNTNINHSILPGYYIFLNGLHELEKMDGYKKQKIKSICDRVLAREDKTGFFSPEKIEIDFMDALTNRYALGQLSRDV